MITRPQEKCKKNAPPFSRFPDIFVLSAQTDAAFRQAQKMTGGGIYEI